MEQGDWSKCSPSFSLLRELGEGYGLAGRPSGGCMGGHVIFYFMFLEVVTSPVQQGYNYTCGLDIISGWGKAIDFPEGNVVLDATLEIAKVGKSTKYVSLGGY